LLAVIVVLIIKYHTQIWDFMKMIWGKIANFFSTWYSQEVAKWEARWNTLKSVFYNSMVALGRIVVNLMSAISTFFTSPWTTIKNIWNAAPGWFVSIARSIGSGFMNMITSRFNAVIAWFRAIPGRIRGAIANPGSILAGIGRAIMNGLISGIESAIPGLRGLLGSITNMLPSWKGPPSVDKKLLFANGVLTMKGFGAGIDAQVPWLKKKLQGITSAIPSLVQPPRPVVSGSSGAPAVASGSDSGMTGAVQQYFTINTQEIDPRKHAADLGIQVRMRMG
jgi:hypothetical protein